MVNRKRDCNLKVPFGWWDWDWDWEDESGSGSVWIRPVMKARRSEPCWRILLRLRASLLFAASAILFDYQSTQFSSLLSNYRQEKMLRKSHIFGFEIYFKIDKYNSCL